MPRFWAFVTQEAEWVQEWKNPKRISWFHFKSTPWRFHLTFLQPTTNRASLLYSIHFNTSNTIKNKYAWPRIKIYTNLSCVIVRVGSISVLTIWLSLQPRALLMALSLRSDKLCRQSSIRTTSSWFLERRGLDLKTLSHINKGNPDWLWKAVRPLHLLCILLFCRLTSDVIQFVFSAINLHKIAHNDKAITCCNFWQIYLKFHSCNPTITAQKHHCQRVTALRHLGCAATSSAHLYLCSVILSSYHMSSNWVTLFRKVF